MDTTIRNLADTPSEVDYSKAIEILSEYNFSKYGYGTEVNTEFGKGIIVSIIMPANGLYISPERTKYHVWYGTAKASFSSRWITKEFSFEELEQYNPTPKTAQTKIIIDCPKMITNNWLFRKIPILISKYKEEGIKGWRAEITDTYDNYKPLRYNQINFEDIGFHFSHNVSVNEIDQFVFDRKKDAYECARFINKEFLKGKAKIHLLK